MKMKKLVIAAAAVLSLSAFADTSFTYVDGQQKDQSTGGLLHVNIFGAKTSVAKGLDADLSINNKQDNETNVITNRTEAGLTFTQGLGPVDAYVRGSLGEKQKSGANTFSYYTVEPGVSVKLPANLSAKVGYYFRQATQDNNADTLREMRYSVGYNLTTNDKINVGYQHSLRGDGPMYDTKFVSYTRSF
jgi:hypothetical protein